MPSAVQLSGFCASLCLVWQSWLQTGTACCTAGQGKAYVQLQKRPKALEKSLLKKPESYPLRAVSGCSEEFEEVHSPATKAQMTYYCIGTLKKDEQLQ